MSYKISNIFSKTYDYKLNMYVVEALVSYQGKCKIKKLFYAFKEDADAVKVGDIIGFNNEERIKE